jgi:hypothetical protein
VVSATPLIILQSMMPAYVLVGGGGVGGGGAEEVGRGRGTMIVKKNIDIITNFFYWYPMALFMHLRGRSSHGEKIAEPIPRTLFVLFP